MWRVDAAPPEQVTESVPRRRGTPEQVTQNVPRRRGASVLLPHNVPRRRGIPEGMIQIVPSRWLPVQYKINNVQRQCDINVCMCTQ